MKIDTLFLRKLLVAFLVGFGGAVIPAVLNVGPLADLNTLKSVWVSILSGGLVAGLRAVLVLIPGLNLVPSDANPIIKK